MKKLFAPSFVAILLAFALGSFPAPAASAAGVPQPAKIVRESGDEPDVESLGIATEALPEATEGVAYSETLEATGGTPPYIWSLVPADYTESTAASSFAEAGEAQGWNADDSSWPLDLPFAFPFYGKNYTQVRVNSNGTLNFDDAYLSDYSYSAETFASHPMIAVLWKDLATSSPGDIFVEATPEAATISWRCEYLNGGAVNASATLYADGRIVLSYGDGNEQGGFIGISAGDGVTQLVSAFSDSSSMANADDIVFAPQSLPAGLELASDGTLAGSPDEPGEYTFSVAVADGGGAIGTATLTLTVAENPALRPGRAGSPRPPAPGSVNAADFGEVAFVIAVTHPDGESPVAVAWSIDGETVDSATDASGATFAFADSGEDLPHVVRATASAADLPKTAVCEWRVGWLSVTDPEELAVSAGMNATLTAEVSSTGDATVTWYDAATDEELGEGETLLLNDLQADLAYYFVAESAYGIVTSAVATIAVDPAPLAGRIYKLTGPAFVGNRLVLRAKGYGAAPLSYEWRRDGEVVSTEERLDIPALADGDFGDYTFTVRNAHGSATSEAFALAPAPFGVPVGWGADGHGRTAAPEGLTGVAQVASGMNFNLALATNGTVTAWGYNGHGGCDVPDGLSGVSFLAAGGYESQGAGFAVKTDGTVVAWGTPMEVDGYWDEQWVDTSYEEWVDTSYEDEESGEWIEDGHWEWIEGGYWEEYWYASTNGWDTVSTMPADLADVVKVAVGGEFAVALKADGSVVTWGKSPDYAAPEDLADVVDIAAGGRFAVALKADGAVVVWGEEWYMEEYGVGDVPPSASGSLAVAATKCQWEGAAFALRDDGSLAGWGGGWNGANWYGLRDTPASDVGMVAVDGGQYHAMALDANGNVFVWGSTWYDQDDIPASVQDNAVGIAAGGYHCTAILLDTDGDTIADTEEELLGRDPLVWEDWQRVSVSGTVTVAGEAPSGGVTLLIVDASGAVRARVAADETGAYVFDDVIPGRYYLKIEATGAVDVWAGDVRPGDGGEAPFSTAGGGEPLDARDFDLAPGQGDAWAQPVALEVGGDPREEAARVELPDGTAFYLDFWPVDPAVDGRILLGEVAASHAAMDGTTLLPHTLAVKPAETGAQIPAPDCGVVGVEGGTVEANPLFSAESGAVSIATDPAGAEVWIDYADESLGTTPLVVDNLAAASHALLLRKDGYLLPRPIRFAVDAGGTTEIGVPLEPETGPAMSVAVSSAIPGMAIYLDYLPTDAVTPATVGGMDPASHAGDLWHSTPHAVLLRHPALSPFAPRAVPEWDVDAGTGKPVAPEEPAALSIDAPNTYEDSDGDGIRNDQEVAAGTDPFRIDIPEEGVSATADGGGTITVKPLDGAAFIEITQFATRADGTLVAEVAATIEGTGTASHGFCLIVRDALGAAEGEWTLPCTLSVESDGKAVLQAHLSGDAERLFVLGLSDGN